MHKSSGAVAGSCACSGSSCIADGVTWGFISLVYLILCISILDKRVFKDDMLGSQHGLQDTPSLDFSNESALLSKEWVGIKF